MGDRHPIMYVMDLDKLDELAAGFRHQSPSDGDSRATLTLVREDWAVLGKPARLHVTLEDRG